MLFRSRLIVGVHHAASKPSLCLDVRTEVMPKIGACRINPDCCAISGGIYVACCERTLERNVVLSDLRAKIEKQELLGKLCGPERIASLEYVAVCPPRAVVNDLGIV